MLTFIVGLFIGAAAGAIIMGLLLNARNEYTEQGSGKLLFFICKRRTNP